MSFKKSTNSLKKSKSLDVDTQIEQCNWFKRVPLYPFCAKPLFEVAMIQGCGKESEQLLKKIISTKKPSNFVFIHQSDVYQLLENALEYKIKDYPPKLLVILNITVMEIIQKCPTITELSPNMLAKLIKHTLIYFMYQQVKAKVLKDIQNKIIESELISLSAENGKDNFFMKKKKKIPEGEDYTTYPLEKTDENETDLKHQTYFYILYGFEDLFLVRHLKKVNVTVNLILGVQLKDKIEIFTDKVEQIINNKEEKIRSYFSDVVFMTYTPNLITIQNEDFYRKKLKEIEKIISEIVNLKINHLNYLKNLKYVTSKSEHFPPPYNIYDNFLEPLKWDNIDAVVILEGILRQVDWFFDDNRTYDGVKEEPKAKKRKCPFNFNYVFDKNVDTEKEQLREVKHFHENDEMNIRLAFYKADIEPSLIKLFHLHTNFMLNKEPLKKTSVEHLHSGVPEKLKQHDEDTIDHFINVLLIHKTNYCSTKKVSLKMPNLIKYDKESILKSFIKGEVPRCDDYYNKVKALTYNWEEYLTPSVLAQFMFQANLDYTCADYNFCGDTNTITVRFYHNVDNFGCKHTASIQSVRAVPNLNMFCKSTLFNDVEWKMPESKRESVTELDETFRRISQNKSFIEYSHLLGTEIIAECCCLNYECEKCRPKKCDDLKDTVFGTISEMKSYTTSQDLSGFCKNLDSASGLIAYHKQSDSFSLTGCKHEFISHDGVKIVVDSSRFLYQSSKLAASIEADKNTLYIYLNEEKLNMHYHLDDGTIIVIKINQSRKPIDLAERNMSASSWPLTISLSTHWKTKKKNSKCAVCVAGAHSKRLPITPSRLVQLRRYECENMAQIMNDRQLTLIKLLRVPVIIFHESSKKKYRYIESKKANFFKSFHNVFRRIFSRKRKHRHLKFCRKIGLSNNEPSINKVEIDVVLPNGLKVESLRYKNEVIIKQYYMNGSTPAAIGSEKYRLFFPDGLVLIHFNDGHMTLYDAKGTMVRFSPGAEREARVKLGRMECIDDIKNCRKLLRGLMEKRFGLPEQYKKYSTSRRSLGDDVTVYEMNDWEELGIANLPFKKIVVIKDDGSQLKIAKYVTKRKMHRVKIKICLQPTQLLKIRTDGFSSLLYENGSQVFKYPDSTTISMDFIDNWLKIDPIYLYKHPHYLPVSFSLDTMEAEVIFKNNRKLSMHNNKVVMNFDQITVARIDISSIVFEKKCKKCHGQFEGLINLEPYFSNEELNHQTFLTCTDSYEKKISFNFKGQCFKSDSFIKRETNKYGCDHVSNNEYQKLFLLRPNTSSSLLWNKQMLLKYVDKCKMSSAYNKKLNRLLESRRLREFLKLERYEMEEIRFDFGFINERGIIRFLKSWFEPYNERFVWNVMDLHTSKNFKWKEKETVYKTTRVINNLISENEVEEYKKLLRSRGCKIIDIIEN